MNSIIGPFHDIFLFLTREKYTINQNNLIYFV